MERGLDSKENPIGASKTYSCFMAHEWGTVSDKPNTHEKVKAISTVLCDKGLEVWLDENHLRGEVASGIMKGLQQSKCCVVFLTKRYLERCNDPNNNCAKEFKAATKIHKIQKMIVVLLDPEVANPTSWFGVVQFELGDKLYIDLSKTENWDHSIPQLYDEILRVIAQE